MLLRWDWLFGKVLLYGPSFYFYPLLVVAEASLRDWLEGVHEF